MIDGDKVGTAGQVVGTRGTGGGTGWCGAQGGGGGGGGSSETAGRGVNIGGTEEGEEIW